jgi:hypothetical protein
MNDEAISYDLFLKLDILSYINPRKEVLMADDSWNENYDLDLSNRNMTLLPYIKLTSFFDIVLMLDVNMKFHSKYKKRKKKRKRSFHLNA